MAKIRIASKILSPTQYNHVYLVYDPDGNPTSGDEQVFRGGDVSSSVVII